jgi:hypothetical protein
MRNFFISAMCLAMCAFEAPVIGNTVTSLNTIEKCDGHCAKWYSKHHKKKVFGSASFRMEPNAEPVLIQQGPVLFNQTGPLSSKVKYNPSTGMFTVKESGIYEIEYRAKVAFADQDFCSFTSESVQQLLRLVVSINGVSYGEIKLSPDISPIMFMTTNECSESQKQQYIFGFDTQTGQLIKKLSKGDTIQLCFDQIPLVFLPEFMTVGSGAETLAYISFHKI